MDTREKRIKLFYVVGVEGCGHHGMLPVITAALKHSKEVQAGKVEVHAPLLSLHEACCDLWYMEHRNSEDRVAARDRIAKIMQALVQRADAQGMKQILIKGNSFPSCDHRSLSGQWDLVEMAEIMGPYVDLNFLGLYRDPIATTYSHKDWDGGLRGHAGIIAAFLAYLDGVLGELKNHHVRIIHYEDLMDRPGEVTPVLAGYLGVADEDVRFGLGYLARSGKNWEAELPQEEQDWLREFFNRERSAEWSIFSDSSKNILPDSRGL